MGKARGQKFSKGKSKKDTWKKLRHNDIDSFLVDQREDERLGVKDKTNDELFILDQEGSDAFFRAANEQPQQPRRSTRTKEKKDGPLVDLDNLKCFQILKPHSAVKDPLIKRNRTKLPGERKSVDMKLKDEIRRFKKNEAKGAKEAEDSATKDEISDSDPWSAPDPKSVQSVLSNEWLTDEAKRNIIRNRSVHKVKKPPTQLKAVEAPHPGLSINPSFLDHQDILKQTVELTKAEIKKEQKLIRATAIPKDAVKEGEEVDVIKEEEEVEIKSEPESDDESKRGVLRPKPKTKQQKRKARELLLQQQAAQEKKERLKMEAEVFRIKSLKKEITKKEQESKERLKKKIEKKEKHEKFGQLDLGRHKFVPLKPDPLLSDQIQGSFLADAQNSIKDLTMERFKSLQKRNLIEPRVKQRMQRKYKLKRYQRPSEKMEWEKTGMWNGEKLLNPGDRRKTNSFRGRGRGRSLKKR